MSIIYRILARLLGPSPVQLIPVDLDCRAIMGYAMAHGRWTAARHGDSPTTQMETELIDPGLDASVHLAIKQALTRYSAMFPALQVTRDETYRVMRYEPGQEFPMHVDQNSTPLQATRVLSVIIYLNDDFGGGHTIFPAQGITIRPRASYCLLLPAGYTHPHASTPITRGTKYVVVTHLHIGPPWLSEVE